MRRPPFPPSTRWVARLSLALAILVVAVLIAAVARTTIWAAPAKVTGAPARGDTHPPAVRGTIAPPLADPANCSQGSHALVLDPGPGDQHNAILQAFDTLGQEGGGTLYLGPGTFIINETLQLQFYSNVSIQGSGMGETVLSLPADPVGNFTADNGTPVGQYNLSVGGAVNGTTTNFIVVNGPDPIDNFELCNLGIDAQANNATNDWAGSLLYDQSGGNHHVYSDVAEDGFFGPSTTPNGIHLEVGVAEDHSPATGYIVDGLYADNNSLPYENYSGYKGGPNFLNVGPIQNCTLDGVVAIGQSAFEVAPANGCVIENWNITGHMLIDPVQGGSWNWTLFQNVTVNSNGTAAPNALAVSVSNGTGGLSSNFTEMQWNDDTFVGTVFGGNNMIDVENSTFWGGIDRTPPTFLNNEVYWADQSPDHIGLPISVAGSPTGGEYSVVSGNRFIFPSGTTKEAPLQLTVPVNEWSSDTVEIWGPGSEFLFSAPGLELAASSTFSHLNYDSLGNDSPVDLLLVDVLGSPGFVDEGAAFWSLSGVFSDLPEITPSPAADVQGVAASPDSMDLTWDAAVGPLTNYSVALGPNVEQLGPAVSVGNRTSYLATGLAPNMTYVAAVVAWNSSHGSVPAMGSAVTTPDWAPAVPSDLAVTVTEPLTVGLSWAPARGHVTNYSILIGQSPSDLDQSYSVGNATSYQISGLNPATTYYCAVEAWNDSWGSGPSHVVTATTLSGPPQPTPSGPAWYDGGLSILIVSAVMAVIVVVPIVFASVLRGRSGRRR